VTRIERENLIERYLRGEMSLEEEENFFIEVASNPELRYELKAYQVVERAIAGDRTAGDRPYTALRARMQKQLAASHPIAAQAGTTINASSSSRKRWVATVIAGTIMILALVFFSRNTHQETSVQTTHSQPAPGLRDSGVIATPQSLSEPASTQQSATTNVTTAPPSNAETVSSVPAAITRSTAEPQPAARQRHPAKRRSVISEGSTQQATSNDHGPAESLDTSTADANDSISIRFELMTPRSSQ
jgi:hypothetical protein